jgi:DNA-binding phage protein
MTTATATPTTQDTSLHDRWLKEQMEDPEFRGEYERERREIAVIDAIVNALDELRAERGLSKAELAREIGKNPASIRRLLTAPGNPELRTIVAVADVLDAEIKVVPRKRSAHRQRKARETAQAASASWRDHPAGRVPWRRRAMGHRLLRD